MEEWGHTIIEDNFQTNENHSFGNWCRKFKYLKYVKNKFQYDIIKPSKFFYEKSLNIQRVNNIYWT